MPAVETIPLAERLQRTELLLGADTMARLDAAKVILFGVGGVGSWCAESLVRSGIRHLTIVDPDCVVPSNVNRQLMATMRTLGRPKVEALRERLLEIFPEAEITALQAAYKAETAAEYNLDAYDYVLDCIDPLKEKMLLIEHACLSRAQFFSSMGAALKLDPTKVRVAGFWDVQMDPLAKMLRKRFRQEGRSPARNFPCVWSEEAPERTGGVYTKESGRTNGSLSPITAIFGHTLSALVLRDLAAKA